MSNSYSHGGGDEINFWQLFLAGTGIQVPCDQRRLSALPVCVKEKPCWCNKSFWVVSRLLGPSHDHTPHFRPISMCFDTEAHPWFLYGEHRLSLHPKDDHLIICRIQPHATGQGRTSARTETHEKLKQPWKREKRLFSNFAWPGLDPVRRVDKWITKTIALPVY